VAEHPEVFDHVGLLFNEPLAVASCPLFSRPTTLIAGSFEAREWTRWLRFNHDGIIAGDSGKAIIIMINISRDANAAFFR
jgi:hypothetical protein